MDVKEQEILNRHREISKEGFAALQEMVIDQKACCYCGCCVSACPSQSIAMGDDSPELVDKCNDCGICYLACPRTFLPMSSMHQWSFNTKEIPPLGTYTSATLASSTSKEILAYAPAGGSTTSIFTKSGANAARIG